MLRRRLHGTVYIGSWDSHLYALDADTGQPKWSFKAGEDPAIHNQVGFQSSPAVVDGVVYVGCRDAHVYALDAATGRRMWDYPTSKSWVIGTPAVRDGMVYVGTSDSSRFMALDAKTGRLSFNFDAKAYIFSSAALAGDSPTSAATTAGSTPSTRRPGAGVGFRTEASKADPMKVLNPDGTLDQAAFAPVFGDFEDMYIDFYGSCRSARSCRRRRSTAAWSTSAALDGNLYALG